MIDATSFVKAMQDRQLLKIGCIEEVAFRNGCINKVQLLEPAKKHGNSEYGKYLSSLTEQQFSQDL